MYLHKFFPVQEPQPEEFDEAFLDAALNAVNRFSITMQPGIVPADSLYAVTGDARFQQLGEFAMTTIAGATGDVDPFILNIGSGMAFSRNPVNDPAELPYDPTNSTDLKMERIFISPTQLTAYNANNPSNTDELGNPLPKSTGSLNIELNPRAYLPDGPRASSKTYYVYVAHMLVPDTLTSEGGAPINKYTINPHSGQINYTHWIDGYQLKLYDGSPSTDTDDIYLGTVTCTATGITTIVTEDREYAYIPSSIIRAKLSSSLLTATYNYEAYVSLSEHINAIGDPNLVGPGNPHGTRPQDIPGVTAAGPYINTPENFHTNGIVDASGANPGPFYCSDVSEPGGLWRTAKLSIPSGSQTLYVYGKLFQRGGHFWSQVYDGISALSMQEIFESGGDPILRADFAFGVRSAGYYVVYGEYYAPVDPDLAGLAIKAQQVVGTLDNIVANPASFLPSPTTQYPFAVCYWNGNQFTALTDPQTGYTNPDYKMIDVRQFGTIGSSQLSNNKRCYPSDLTPHRDVVAIDHNVYIPKQLTVGTTMTVSGTLAATYLTGDGSGITNFPLRAFGQASSANIAYVSTTGWMDIPGYSVTVTTHGGPLICTWNAAAATAAGKRACFRFVIDGVPVTGCALGNTSLTAIQSMVYQPVAANWIAAAAAGNHTVKMQWRSTTATTTIYINEYAAGPESTLTVHEG